MTQSNNEDKKEEEVTEIEKILTNIGKSITDEDLDEIVMSGDTGYHIFIDPDRDNPIADITKKLHEAFDIAIKDVYINEEEIREKYGEVTPKTICKQIENQIENNTGPDGLHGEFFKALAKQMKTEIEEGPRYFSKLK